VLRDEGNYEDIIIWNLGRDKLAWYCSKTVHPSL
jgi:hypothetical protein